MFILFHDPKKSIIKLIDFANQEYYDTEDFENTGDVPFWEIWNV